MITKTIVIILKYPAYFTDSKRSSGKITKDKGCQKRLTPNPQILTLAEKITTIINKSKKRHA